MKLSLARREHAAKQVKLSSKPQSLSPSFSPPSVYEEDVSVWSCRVRPSNIGHIRQVPIEEGEHYGVML
jgi:hypothetical protein